MNEKQVDKEHYNFLKYCTQDRWNSYYNQISETLKIKPDSTLEIGPGDKIYGNILKNIGLNYKDMDIAKDIEPDILGDVLDMPIGDNIFDLVCAFEVLEHLPFKNFKKALSEIKRVSKKNILISLPHWGRHFSIELRIPFFKKIRIQIKFSIIPKKHEFDDQHYWEIGKRGYSLKKIRKAIKESGLKIKRDYVVFHSPYHHFFILEK